MKFVLVLCLVLLTLTIASGKKNKQNNEEREKSIKKAFKECQKNEETRIDNAVLKKLKKHRQVTLPDNYGEHKLCVLKGAGYINEDGSVNEETLKKKVTKKASEDQDVTHIVSECKAAKATPQETAINIEMCLSTNGIDL